MRYARSSGAWTLTSVYEPNSAGAKMSSGTRELNSVILKMNAGRLNRIG